MGVSKTTVQCWIVTSTIHVHSNSLKPILTEENKLARLLMANHFTDPQDPSKYQDMRDCIQLDEKWFFLTQEKEQCLLLSDEKNPKHCVKHKSHITKVMFLCTVVRLHFNPSANSWWDRKLGIWLIGDWEPAKWKSKNRPKGTLVWKNKTVTKEVFNPTTQQPNNPTTQQPNNPTTQQPKNPRTQEPNNPTTNQQQHDTTINNETQGTSHI